MEIYKSQACWENRHSDCTERIACDCSCHAAHKQSFVDAINKLKSVIGDKKCLVCLTPISAFSDFDKEECKDKFIKDHVG